MVVKAAKKKKYFVVSFSIHGWDQRETSGLLLGHTFGAVSTIFRKLVGSGEAFYTSSLAKNGTNV